MHSFAVFQTPFDEMEAACDFSKSAGCARCGCKEIVLVTATLSQSRAQDRDRRASLQGTLYARAPMATRPPLRLCVAS